MDYKIWVTVYTASFVITSALTNASKLNFLQSKAKELVIAVCRPLGTEDCEKLYAIYGVHKNIITENKKMRALINEMEESEWRKFIFNIPDLKKEIGTCRESKGDRETMVYMYKQKTISSYKLDLLWKDQWPLALVPSVNNILKPFWGNGHYILVIAIIQQDKTSFPTAKILAKTKNPTATNIKEAVLNKIAEEKLKIITRKENKELCDKMISEYNQKNARGMEDRQMRGLINDITLKDWRILILNMPDIADSIRRLPISSYNDMEISVIEDVNSNAILRADYSIANKITNDAVVKARKLPLAWSDDEWRIGLMPGIENREFYPVIMVVATWVTNPKPNIPSYPIVLGAIKDPSLEKIHDALSKCGKEELEIINRYLDMNTCNDIIQELRTETTKEDRDMLNLIDEFPEASWHEFIQSVPILRNFVRKSDTVESPRIKRTVLTSTNEELEMYPLNLVWHDEMPIGLIVSTDESGESPFLIIVAAVIPSNRVTVLGILKNPNSHNIQEVTDLQKTLKPGLEIITRFMDSYASMKVTNNYKHYWRQLPTEKMEEIEMLQLINQLSTDDWSNFMFNIKELQNHLSTEKKGPLNNIDTAPLDKPLSVSPYEGVVIEARRVGLYFGEMLISLIPGVGKFAGSPYILVLTPVCPEREFYPQDVHVLAILKGPTLENLRESITQAAGYKRS